MRFHGHFPNFLHKPWRIITGTAWQTADNRHWEGAHWARGGLVRELHWLGLHWLGLHCLGLHCLGLHCLGLHWQGSHWLGLHWHWIILYRENVLYGTKCCFCCRLFHLNRFIGTKSRITPENLDEHHFFDVNGNIVFTSAEVRFSTRLICSFDERNSKRSRLAKSYFCVLLKSRNEFMS